MRIFGLRFPTAEEAVALHLVYTVFPVYVADKLKVAFQYLKGHRKNNSWADLPGEHLSSSAHKDDFQNGCIVALECLQKAGAKIKRV